MKVLFRIRITYYLLNYATCKVRKFESLFYKINTFLQKITTYIGLQADQTFSVNMKHTHFFNFWSGFRGFFPMLFPKASAFCNKKFLKYFLLHGTSICMSSTIVSQIFKILFQTGDINIFVLRCVFFSRYVQIKSSFLDEKFISGAVGEVGALQSCL